MCVCVCVCMCVCVCVCVSIYGNVWFYRYVKGCFFVCLSLHIWYMCVGLDMCKAEFECAYKCKSMDVLYLGNY